ncbi:T9SS type A sorting domain-containing protein [Dyadobacter chenwenxiniae]|uniref:T9SS type A sorting domain-containing protein n=1 Tax=Dyadobacter chenwenxiniae TaxID=2906456 RepID=A0A9X1PS23_9BACT|nr:TIM-barrel domain-containing protein [Dyadobacter chenwenxiniae]MCF0064041.1 T9SS type A sorting domain-containing protein [Dyadobacter chenwenxiniae]UON82769.1 T9SS type A sorting domain-containing protein [Dyadobacter chenwenxiniae]
MIYKYFLILLFVVAGKLSFGQGAGNFVSYETANGSIEIHGTKGVLRIQMFSPEIFKVQALPSKNAPGLDSSYSVILPPSTAALNIVETKNNIEIRSEKCALVVDKFPINVALKSGNEVKIKETRGFVQTKDSVSFLFDINPKDVFHGAGGRPFGPDLNRKGFDFYNSWEYEYFDQSTGLAQSFNVPFIISSHKCGLFFDSDRPGSMRMYVGAVDSTLLRVESASTGKWAYYLIHGNNNDEILANYTLLTGRQPLPPRWAFGYIQSKSGYDNESEATVAITKLQDQGFPVDALALDQHWYGGQNVRGNMDWDTKNWPSSAGMVKSLLDKGVKTILVADPYISTKSTNYKSAEAQSLFAKKPSSAQTYTQDVGTATAGLLDIFKPAAQGWLWEKHKKMALQGVAGWWSEKTEPDPHPMDAVHELGNAFQIHNLYALFWSKTFYNNFTKDFPEKRIFHMTRSGWAGSQRYGALPWSGDVSRYWAGLKLQIPIILQAGMSGLGYMHSDVGGAITMSDKAEKDEELDLRWFQFGTFTPILKVAGQRENIEPFNLSEPFYSTVKKYATVRYQLLPYIYSLAWKNSVSGRPVCLPMDYFNNVRALGNISDQYFFGENLLVAPVLLHGMPLRKVVLPPGKWFDFWNDEIYNGNANIFPKLTVDHIPVYARGGSFIPMSTSTTKKSTDYYNSDSLTVRFYQDISVPTSSFTMFHDDGNDPNSLSKSKYELVDFIGNVSNDQVNVTVQRTKSFDKSLAKRRLTFEIKNLTTNPTAVLLNGQAIPIVYLSAEFKSNTAYYNLLGKQLKVQFDWDCNTTAAIAVTRDGLDVITGSEPNVNDSVLTVFPNPAGSRVSVKVTVPETGFYDLEVYNVAGISVYKSTLGQHSKGKVLDLSLNLRVSSGAYLVRLWNDQGQFFTKKIVIQ